MTRPWGTALAVLLTASSLWAAPNGITLVGEGLVSGTALDKSGLNGSICQAGVPTNCVPKAIFGGFGSDITYSGHDNVFLAAPDRGPFDGLTDVPYLDRVHFLHITTNLGLPFQTSRRRCWTRAYLRTSPVRPLLVRQEPLT